MKIGKLLFLVFICLSVLSITQVTMAQNIESCPVFVQQALMQLGNNCAITERNSVCYGFPNVTALDMTDTHIANFAQPSDHTNLIDLQEVNTTAFNLSKNEWGLAITNIQANLPIGLPGQGGILVSIGNVRLENGITTEEALILPESSLSLTTTTAGDIYNTLPGLGNGEEVVGAVFPGTILEADGLSEDGEWVRVFFIYPTSLGMSASAWISLSAFSEDVDLSELPIITSNSMTPMQKFYLTNDTTEPLCPEVPPSMLLVQGPEEIELDLMINDAQMRISSTAIVRIMPPGNIMQVIAISGLVVLDPNGEQPVLLAPGFFSLIGLTEPVDLGVDGRSNDRSIRPGANWSEPAMLDRGQLERLALALDNRIPANLLYYAIKLPQLICPSGVGSPICSIILPRLERRLRELCRLHILPRSICTILNFPTD